MRRMLAVAAASLLVLSSVGGAVGVEPGAVAPAPAGPAPSADPTPSASGDPTGDPGDLLVDPSAAPTTAPSAVPDPDVRPSAPIVEAPRDPGPAGTSSPARPSARPSVTPSRPPAKIPRADTDPTDRWIVLLKAGSDPVATADRQGRKIGFVTDRLYKHAFRGFSATLDRAQVTALSHDSAVRMIVADERISSEAQTMPTGISRIGATRSTVAKIDGLDQRVDADVAIVDTGITSVVDLNVAGGYNCSTTNRALWRDVYGHGTHVAGTVGAIDNGSGVVGVAPGVRLWAVKILNDSGDGLLSWYVCGLDWIAAQRDPGDASRPLFEAVNMSVAKYGNDDANCGLTNSDILHQAICRLVASGVTVVAAAGNDDASASLRVPAAYNEVITVSALADTDGKAGGLGGHRCLSWGTYDVDDTIADFSNHGSDIDLIAPGKCIWSTVPGGYAYSSGTSMAAPHVAGAAALLKATRPGLTPSEVREALQYLGNLNWNTASDTDGFHEKLLDVSRIGPRGTFGVAAGGVETVGLTGGSARIGITTNRSTTSFERIRFSATGLPTGATASFDPISVYGFGSAASTLTVTMPGGLTAGTYRVTVVANEHGTTHSTVATINVSGNRPVAAAPVVSALAGSVVGSTTLRTRVGWPAATNSSDRLAGYELEWAVDTGLWKALASTSASVRSVIVTQSIGHTYRFRVRARDTAGNWSGWVVSATNTSSLVSDRSTAVTYSGTWRKALYGPATNGSTTYATATGARARLTFTGRSVALIAPKGTTRGSATIYVDGVNRATVSFRSSSGLSRAIMYAIAFSTVGTHTIDVRVSGTGRVDIDGFVVFR